MLGIRIRYFFRRNGFQIILVCAIIGEALMGFDGANHRAHESLVLAKQAEIARYFESPLYLTYKRQYDQRALGLSENTTTLNNFNAAALEQGRVSAKPWDKTVLANDAAIAKAFSALDSLNKSELGKIDLKYAALMNASSSGISPLARAAFGASMPIFCLCSVLLFRRSASVTFQVVSILGALFAQVASANAIFYSAKSWSGNEVYSVCFAAAFALGVIGVSWLCDTSSREQLLDAIREEMEKYKAYKTIIAGARLAKPKKAKLELPATLGIFRSKPAEDFHIAIASMNDMPHNASECADIYVAMDKAGNRPSWMSIESVAAYLLRNGIQTSRSSFHRLVQEARAA